MLISHKHASKVTYLYDLKMNNAFMLLHSWTTPVFIIQFSKHSFYFSQIAKILLWMHKFCFFMQRILEFLRFQPDTQKMTSSEFPSCRIPMAASCILFQGTKSIIKEMRIYKGTTFRCFRICCPIENVNRVLKRPGQALF